MDVPGFGPKCDVAVVGAKVDDRLFVSGFWYKSGFNRTNEIVIQNNWIQGNSAKINRAKEFGQWFLKENGLSCQN